jgi:hypothetical protein
MNLLPAPLLPLNISSTVPTTVTSNIPDTVPIIPGVSHLSNDDNRQKTLTKIIKILNLATLTNNAKVVTVLYKKGILSYGSPDMNNFHFSVWTLLHTMSVTRDETSDPSYTRDWNNLRDEILFDLYRNLAGPQERIIIMGIIHWLKELWTGNLNTGICVYKGGSPTGPPILIESIVKFFADDIIFTKDDVLELLDIAATYDSDIMVEALLKAKLRD